MKTLFQLVTLFSFAITQAQDVDYYKEIPNAPEAYSAGTVAGRMVDGLGFRFYWATDGLRDEDLLFKPGEESRTALETIDHIYGMSIMISNAVEQRSGQFEEGLTFAQKRAATLNNLRRVSNVLKQSKDEDLDNYVVKGSTTTFPFWNLVNGPIADCLWHCGQIVSFRRSSGNPLNSSVSFFNGRLRN